MIGCRRDSSRTPSFRQARKTRKSRQKPKNHATRKPGSNDWKTSRNWLPIIGKSAKPGSNHWKTAGEWEARGLRAAEAKRSGGGCLRCAPEEARGHRMISDRANKDGHFCKKPQNVPIFCPLSGVENGVKAEKRAVGPARGGNAKTLENQDSRAIPEGKPSRGGGIRTRDIKLPKLALYQAEPRPGNKKGLRETRRRDSLKVAGSTGLEPATPRSTIWCSNRIELRPRSLRTGRV